jgi:hypothetical protein
MFENALARQCRTAADGSLQAIAAFGRITIKQLTLLRPRIWSVTI